MLGVVSNEITVHTFDEGFQMVDVRTIAAFLALSKSDHS